MQDGELNPELPKPRSSALPRCQGGAGPQATRPHPASVSGVPTGTSSSQGLELQVPNPTSSQIFRSTSPSPEGAEQRDVQGN